MCYSSLVNAHNMLCFHRDLHEYHFHCFHRALYEYHFLWLTEGLVFPCNWFWTWTSVNIWPVHLTLPVCLPRSTGSLHWVCFVHVFHTPMRSLIIRCPTGILVSEQHSIIYYYYLTIHGIQYLNWPVHNDMCIRSWGDYSNTNVPQGN